MSTSSIECRECGNVVAKRHHSGRVNFEVGIRVVLLKDGRVQAVCPCGGTRVIVSDSQRRAA